MPIFWIPWVSFRPSFAANMVYFFFWAKNLPTFQTSFLLSFYIIPEEGGSRFLSDVCACPHGIAFLVTNPNLHCRENVWSHTQDLLLVWWHERVFRYNQQDATLHSGIYYYICSTCFRWFLCPSSGAQNSTQHRVFVELFLRCTRKSVPAHSQ